MTGTKDSRAAFFILSDVVTQFGAGMIMTASAWYIFDESRSNSLVALAAAANTVSGIVMSLFAGTIVDRFNAKRVAQASHLLRIFLIALPLIFFQNFGFHPIFAFILALNNGLGWNLYFPASKSIINNLTKDRGRVGVNSAAEVSMQIGLFSSGALAGLLYNVIGFVPILLISIGAFVLGIAILSGVKFTPDNEQGERGSLLDSFRGGFTFARRSPALFGVALVLFFPFVAANIFATILPGYVATALQGNAPIYGLVDMSWGAAAALAGVLVAATAKRIPMKSVVVVGLSVLVGYGIAMYFTSNWLVALSLTAIAGFAAASTRIVLYSELMDSTPPEVFGRVLSLTNMIGLLLQTVFAQLAGWLMDVFGAGSGFLIVTVILAAGLALFLGTSRALVREPRRVGVVL